MKALQTEIKWSKKKKPACCTSQKLKNLFQQETWIVFVACSNDKIFSTQNKCFVVAEYWLLACPFFASVSNDTSCCAYTAAYNDWTELHTGHRETLSHQHTFSCGNSRYTDCLFCSHSLSNSEIFLREGRDALSGWTFVQMSYHMFRTQSPYWLFPWHAPCFSWLALFSLLSWQHIYSSLGSWWWLHLFCFL